MEGTNTGSSAVEGLVVKKENKVEPDDDQDAGKMAKLGNKRKAQDDEDNTFRPRSPNQVNLRIVKHEDQLGCAKAKMCEVREENERLKKLLHRIVKEHRSLQMHIFDVFQQEQVKKSSPTPSPLDEAGQESRDLVLLCLGRSSSDVKEEDESSKARKSKVINKDLREGLALGLDSKFGDFISSGAESSSDPNLENKFSDGKEDGASEKWALSKILEPVENKEEEVQPQTLAKKTRVSVRARCDAPTMNDGCQWRKYGQKISKGNPCPRAYYRCTVGPTCPVRKQVQRCSEDLSILITTYEGTHNHPLSVSATTMASTTSAAANMLMSGSISSCTLPGPSTSNISANIRSLNFNLSDNYRSRQFYSPNSSFSTPSSHPTITLDLTTPSSAPSSSLYTPSQFHQYTPASLNFSSVDTNNMPTSWSNGYPSYGDQFYHKRPMVSLDPGRQNPGYSPYLHHNNPQHQQFLNNDNIAAATKAITSDPSFRMALEAAITSIVGRGVDMVHGGQDGGDNKIAKILKRSESFPVNPNYSSSSSTTNWNTSSSSSKIKEAQLTSLPPPSFPFARPKSACDSPGETKSNML